MNTDSNTNNKKDPNKPGLRERLRYAFDNYMGKGTIALVCMLFLITAIVVLITGLISSAGGTDGGSVYYVWMSFLHTLDAGNLAGDDTANVLVVCMMTIVTICGIFVTSILIGIISTGFEEKLNSLRKGFSRVIEKRHTVIIGFNDDIFTVISELIEANSNHKNGRILVIGTQDKELMEEEIRNHISDFKTTKVICRSGNPVHQAVLYMSSVETARSIIINEQDDIEVIKIILSLVSYLKSKDAFGNGEYITAIIHDKGNLEAASIAGQGMTEILYFRDILARVIANTCRQPGLSSALTEIMGFAGDEFYYEEFPELVGKKFGDVLNLFQKSIVVGLVKDGRPLVNPPMDTVIESGDSIIHLEEDDGASKPVTRLPAVSIDEKISDGSFAPDDNFDLLILGHNDLLTSILHELGDFLPEGTQVKIACDSLPEDYARKIDGCSSLKPLFIEKNIYDRKELEEVITDDVNNILLLSDGYDVGMDADSRTMLLLLQIRAISQQRGRDYSITSQMDSVDNQQLMKGAKINDFVVGSSITNLMLTQISENRHLNEFFNTLLTAEGSELYMKDARRYIKTGVEMNFYEVTEAVKRYDEIFMGYKRVADGNISMVINPDKAEQFVFEPGDSLIVVAED